MHAVVQSVRWGAGQGADGGPEFKASGRGCHVCCSEQRQPIAVRTCGCECV